MQLIVDQLDMRKTRANWPEDMPFAPALVKPRAQMCNAGWHVLSKIFTPGEVPQWNLTVSDDLVRVPLFRYTLSPSADLAMAFMLQLGLSCAGHLPKNITHFYVVTGTPVELMYDSKTELNTGLVYWVGFAVITKT